MKNYIAVRHIVAVVVIFFMFVAFGLPEVNAAAGDFWIDANLASKHTSSSQYNYNGKTGNYNERNYGLGVSYDMTGTFEATAGFFRNSYNKHSNYVGVKVKHDFNIRNMTVTPGVTVGLVTGYKNTEVEAPLFQPIAVPSITVQYNNFRTVVGYIPLRLATDADTDVITFQIGYRFN